VVLTIKKPSLLAGLFYGFWELCLLGKRYLGHEVTYFEDISLLQLDTPLGINLFVIDSSKTGTADM
jgi:hypothetical protein